MKSSQAMGDILITGGRSMLAMYLSRVLGERAVLCNKTDLDICDTVTFERVLDSRSWAAVINTAGTYGDNRKHLFDVHGFCASDMAFRCFDRNIPFVFISTARVFDGTRNGGGYGESDPPNPSDDYGLSKYLGEQLIRNKGVGHVYYIFRLPMLLGERKTGQERQIIYRLLDLADREKSIKVADDVFHSPVSAEFAAHTICRVLDEAMDPGIYHITGRDHVSLHDLVSCIFSRMGIVSRIDKVSQDFFENTRHFPKNMILASDKLPCGPAWESVVDRFVLEMRSTCSRGVSDDR